MAQSPFQTSGNVADIAPVQLRGGFAPAPGIIDTVADVAGIVVPTIRQNLEDSIVDDVTGKAKAVSLALKATRFPSIQESVFSEEALANPATQQALEEFTLIQDAVKQGRLPSTFALERLELAQNMAIKDAPEFEEEIRGAFRDATGQDPQKALFGRLLSETTTKTAEQKAAESLQIEAIQLGITPDQLVSMNQVAMANQIQQQQYDLAAKKGTYDLNTVSSEVVNKGALIITDVMGDVQRLVTAGLAIGVNEKAELVAKVNAAFGNTTQAILTKTAGLNVSGTAINAELAPLNALRNNTIKMIEDDTMQSLLSQHNKTIVADSQNTFLNNPEYGRLYGVLGAEGTLEFMKFKTMAGNNPQAAALIQALNKDAQGLFKADEILRQASRVGNGENLETTAIKQARILAAGNGLSNTAAGEEYQIKSLEDIKKYGGQALAWSAFESNSVLTATAKSNKLKAAFINMQVTTTAGLSEDLILLASVPSIPVNRLELTREGTLIIKPTDITPTRDARVAAGELQIFVDRFNRASRISAKYNGAGVLPSSRYQSPTAYWDVVREAATAVVKPEEDINVKPIKYIRDATGNIVPVAKD